MLSNQQRAILRKIAEIQIDSFIRIVEERQYEELIREFLEEEFEVTESDILAHLSQVAEMWESIFDEPDKFLNLDELNLNILRHILFQEFERNPETRGLWKKLNLHEKLDISKRRLNIN